MRLATPRNDLRDGYPSSERFEEDFESGDLLDEEIDLTGVNFAEMSDRELEDFIDAQMNG